MRCAPKVFSPNALDLIIFADDTNLFVSDRSVNALSKDKFRAAKNE